MRFQERSQDAPSTLYPQSYDISRKHPLSEHCYKMGREELTIRRRSLAEITQKFLSSSPTPSRRNSRRRRSRIDSIVAALAPSWRFNMALDPPPRALFFDVLGTCVDWRKTVTDELWKCTREALNSPSASIASRIRMVATDMVCLALVRS